MSDCQEFPNTWEEFEQAYGFEDRKEIYTNGSRLIQSFRVKQWLDHNAEPERKWIPVSEALPDNRQKVLCVNKHGEMMVGGYMTDYGMTFPCYFEKPIAWMPLPEPWRGE